MKKRSTLLEDAFERGQTARRAGVEREDCPFGDYPGRDVRLAWEEGWDAGRRALPQPRPAEPTPQPTGVGARDLKWPAGRALPTHYSRPAPTPCASCLALRLVDGRQAVVLRTTFKKVGHDFATLLCRACGFTFFLPITEVHHAR